MMLSADTHHMEGYVCPLCEDTFDSQYANVWRCASKQLDAFLSWCKDQDFYENTTVIVTGDHCSMNLSMYEDEIYDKYHGSTGRLVYNAFLNLPFNADESVTKNREFTTLDFFPTALSSIGISIEGERLGLGVNLFSGEKTLAETYGYDTLFTELDKKSNFYNKNLMYTE